MHTYINRKIEQDVKKNLKDFPVVAILGPRQCGKSTLAKWIISYRQKSVYLDLELESDIRKIEDPELFLLQHENKLVCIDEVQRMPDLFKSLRGIIDRKRGNGRFLILGSASRKQGQVLHHALILNIQSKRQRFAENFLFILPFKGNHLFYLPDISLKS